MDELINYNGYEEFKQAVNRVLNRTVEDFVLTGLPVETGKGYGYPERLRIQQMKKNLPGANTNWMPLRYRDI